MEHESASRSLSVLVVDDEPLIQKMVRRVLSGERFAVAIAADCDAAVAAARESAFDLVITDVSMPDTSGPELSAQLRRLQSDLSVLYVSGYSREEVAEHGVEAGDAFIEKPFTPSQLIEAVEQVIRTRRQP